MHFPVSPSPRFAALTLSVGKPLPYVIDNRTRPNGEVTVHKIHQKQLKREMNAVAQIVKNWLEDRKAEIDKITAGRNILMKLMTEEDFNAKYKDKNRIKSDRTIQTSYGNYSAWASRIGIKLYDVAADGKETKMQVRWPGNNPDGPFFPLEFQDWAEKFITSPRLCFNALSKALKMGVANIGRTCSEAFEDET